METIKENEETRESERDGRKEKKEREERRARVRKGTRVCDILQVVENLRVFFRPRKFLTSDLGATSGREIREVREKERGNGRRYAVESRRADRTDGYGNEVRLSLNLVRGPTCARRRTYALKVGANERCAARRGAARRGTTARRRERARSVVRART